MSIFFMEIGLAIAKAQKIQLSILKRRIELMTILVFSDFKMLVHIAKS